MMAVKIQGIDIWPATLSNLDLSDSRANAGAIHTHQPDGIQAHFQRGPEATVRGISQASPRVEGDCRIRQCEGA